MAVDLAVVGAGIAGLAHAYAAARAGRSVVVLEREPRATGASVRNFGMVWTIGMAGDQHRRALRGRGTWLRLARDAGFWLKPCGALLPAYREDELAVLEEFAVAGPGRGYEVELLEPDAARALAPALVPTGLLGALRSAPELGVDPREALAAVAEHLVRDLGVEVRFGTPVLRVAPPEVELAGGEVLAADAVVVAAGADVRTLFPDVFRAAGVRRCKLQMTRTAPQPAGFELGPHLASGLSLRHYESFADCPSLPRLRARVADETPELDRHGIHVLAAQNGRGEVLLGDSHEYGDDVPPGLSAGIEALVLDHAARLVDLPDRAVASRWAGVYLKPVDSGTPPIATPAPRVRVVVGAGGAGMTTSFALAEETCADLGLLEP